MKTIKNLTADEIRKSILQLAIQGKLVKQDSNDEPASELVKRIYEEKHRLIKEGKIKKDKNESYIYKDDDNCYYEKIGKEVKNITDELPFKIPDSWTWVRIGNYVQKVTDYVASGSFKSLRENVKYYKTDNYALLVKTQDFQNNFTKDLTYTDQHGYHFLENSNLYGGELVLSNVGSVGRVFIVPHLNRKMTLAPNAIMVRFLEEKHLNWFYHLFNSSYGLELLLSISSATAIKKFNKTDFKQLIIPIPPLNEQKRIVSKLIEFEPLLINYENHEKKLTQLESSFEEKLKTSILQYAIEGKLVKQDPNDEPASLLLGRIKNEKERLIKEGKIKKDKNDSIIVQSDDKNYYDDQTNELEIPFEIPKNWLWVYLPRIAIFYLGKTPERNNENYWKRGSIPWVSISDMCDGRIITHTKEKITESALNSVFNGKYIHKGTLLMSFKLTIGRTSILGMDAVHNEAIVSIIPYCDDSKDMTNYLRIFLGLLTQYIDKTTAIKGKTLNKQKLSKMIIPLPPMNEIRRINYKISNLFAFIQG